MSRAVPRSPGEEPIALDVVRAIADFRGVDSTELEPPLHSAIDTSALNRLFEPTRAGERRGQIAFEYDDLSVTVTSDATVWVEQRE